MRARFRALYDVTQTPRLHGVSVMGHVETVYHLTNPVRSHSCLTRYLLRSVHLFTCLYTHGLCTCRIRI
jgi:hypothetical protein